MKILENKSFTGAVLFLTTAFNYLLYVLLIVVALLCIFAGSVIAEDELKKSIMSSLENNTIFEDYDFNVRMGSEKLEIGEVKFFFEGTKIDFKNIENRNKIVNKLIENKKSVLFILYFCFFIVIGMTALIFKYLRNLLRNFKNNEIFILENYKHIKNISIIMFISVIGEYITDVFLDVIIRYYFDIVEVIGESSLFDSIDINELFFACIVLIISQVFKKGVEIQEENSLTI